MKKALINLAKALILFQPFNGIDVKLFCKQEDNGLTFKVKSPCGKELLLFNISFNEDTLKYEIEILDALNLDILHDFIIRVWARFVAERGNIKVYLSEDISDLLNNGEGFLYLLYKLTDNNADIEDRLLLMDDIYSMLKQISEGVFVGCRGL